MVSSFSWLRSKIYGEAFVSVFQKLSVWDEKKYNLFLAVAPLPPFGYIYSRERLCLQTLDDHKNKNRVRVRDTYHLKIMKGSSLNQGSYGITKWEETGWLTQTYQNGDRERFLLSIGEVRAQIQNWKIILQQSAILWREPRGPETERRGRHQFFIDNTWRVCNWF